MAEIHGKYGIRARVLKKSRSAITRAIMVTFEIEYPRMILAELNTHRALSRNSASSRAIPYLKMLEQLTARPVRFGQANPGMQDKGEDYDAPIKIERHLWGAWSAYLEYRHPYITINDTIVEDESGGTVTATAQDAWEFARFLAGEVSKGFYEAGYHKQVFNRLTEASQMMKTVISATEWGNFYWLRDHDAADPTIAELARVMRLADIATSADELQPGEWHLPYVYTVRDNTGVLRYGEKDDESGVWSMWTLDEAIKVSCARCAAVSYRNEDYGVEKSEKVYERLVGDERKHASAFEHCATPMKAYSHGEPLGFGHYDYTNLPGDPRTWEQGISHMDHQCRLWSGNLCGFIQYRKLIPGENYTAT